MNKSLAIAIYAFTSIFFACFFIWPIWQILQGGFLDADGTLTGSYLAEVFRNPIYFEGLRNAFGIGVFSTLFALIIAVPLAFIADRYDFPAKKILMGMVLLPIMLPPLVGAIGLQQILAKRVWST